VSANFTLSDLQVKSKGACLLNELDLFTALDRTPVLREGENFKLLGSWNANKPSCPKLFQLAIRFLSLPATSVAIERQFSRAKKQ
jgi:hypothetical protein